MPLIMRDRQSVGKSRMATSIESYPLIAGMEHPATQKRGATVYNTFELMGQSGYTKDGTHETVTYQIPMFNLTISERIDIARLCSPVFGVVTGRQNRISGMSWTITRKAKDEDREAERLKKCRALYMEYSGELGTRALGVRIRCLSEIIKALPEVKRDLTNFDASLLRWSKAIRDTNEDGCSSIEDWLRHPNQEDSFEDYMKKITFDLMVHGAAAPYKEVQDNKIENLYILPGGTVYPIKGRFIGEATGYIQVVDNFEPQIMFRDELGFIRYSPRSDSSYGSVPLEALVNKVAETLMFDQRAAEMADGTKPPEKLIAFGDRSPFGNLGSEFDMPLPKSEQKRLEQSINEARKDAIRLISGYGTPVVVDVSRADTFAAQMERQRVVREEVGQVFGASNAEMNLTGSDSTSGLSSSETQERYDLYKGIYPIIQAIENFINYDVLPFRYGEGYLFNYQASASEGSQLTLMRAKKDSGLYSVNEIRTRDLGEDPFAGEQYDEPAPAPAPAPVQAGFPGAM